MDDGIIKENTKNNRPLLSDLQFGDGSFVGTFANPDNDEQLETMTPNKLLLILGGVAACSVVESVMQRRIDEGRKNYPLLDDEALLEKVTETQGVRYGKINFWYGHVNRMIEQAGNTKLLTNMQRKLRRERPLSPDKYEADKVPSDYSEYMYPMNTLAAFAIPRMLIDFIDFSKQNTNGDKVSKSDSLNEGLDIIENAIKNTSLESGDPLELMARIAESFADAGLDIDKILKLVLGQAWVDEQDGTTMSGDAKTALKQFAPKLWDKHEKIEKEENKEDLVVND